MIYMTYNENTMKYHNFDDLLREQLKDPKFKKAYDALEVEFQIISDVLKKRIENDISQKELAIRIGSDQATISRLESGTLNPSIKFLKRVAKAVGGQLKVTII